jgi:hypothetical protein
VTDFWTDLLGCTQTGLPPPPAVNTWDPATKGGDIILTFDNLVAEQSVYPGVGNKVYGTRKFSETTSPTPSFTITFEDNSVFVHDPSFHIGIGSSYIFCNESFNKGQLYVKDADGNTISDHYWYRDSWPDLTITYNKSDGSITYHSAWFDVFNYSHELNPNDVPFAYIQCAKGSADFTNWA